MGSTFVGGARKVPAVSDELACVYCAAPIPSARIRNHIAVCAKCGGTFELGGRRQKPTKRRIDPLAPPGVIIQRNPELEITFRDSALPQVIRAMAAGVILSSMFVHALGPGFASIFLVLGLAASAYAYLDPYPLRLHLSGGKLSIRKGRKNKGLLIGAEAIRQISVHAQVRSRVVKSDEGERLSTWTDFELRARLDEGTVKILSLSKVHTALFLEELLELELDIQNEAVPGSETYETSTLDRRLPGASTSDFSIAEVGRLGQTGLIAASSCPRCRTALTREDLGTLQVDICLHCGGQLLHSTPIRVLEHPETRLNPLWGRVLELEARAAANPTEPRPVYLRCPVCSKQMTRRNYLGSSGALIDECLTHGTWLDRGELRRITEFLASGKATRAEKLRSDEAARIERMRKATREPERDPGSADVTIDYD